MTVLLCKQYIYHMQTDYRHKDRQTEAINNADTATVRVRNKNII